MKTITYFFLILLVISCTPPKQEEVIVEKTSPNSQKEIEEAILQKEFPKFDRKSIDLTTRKINDKEPLFIHAFIPLCDNENQGIVPVSKSLGDGFNLRTNLYWGALYGIKTHFKKSKNWKLIYSQKDISTEILERVIFKRVKNGVEIYLIADAYRGDKMKNCLNDYFSAVSGNKKNKIKIESQEINIYGNADLIIFNGHNGLMDVSIDKQISKDNKIRETAAIGCISHDYFLDYFKAARAYPILTTTNLMAPEAYVMEGLIDSWSNLDNQKEIRASAGKAYHKYQKCGIRGATNLFKSGWD